MPQKKRNTEQPQNNSIVLGRQDKCSSSSWKRTRKGVVMAVYCAQSQGNCTEIVEIEAHTSRGYAGITLLGNLSKTCSDGAERARVALESCGLDLPANKIVLSMAPASLKKDGNQYDLAIALTLANLIDPQAYPLPELKTMFAAELSLDGKLKPIKNIVSYVFAAIENEFSYIVTSRANSKVIDLLYALQPELLQKIQFYLCDSLVDLLKSMKSFGDLCPYIPANPIHSDETSRLNFDSMLLDANLSLAAAASALGRHSVLLRGRPGTGKSMWAHRLSSIYPKMNVWDQLESLKIYTGFNEDLSSDLYGAKIPFRSPHHQASSVAILGSVYSPGELSLAHGGILFLDELPEFRRDILEALREPLETKEVHVSRAQEKVVWKCKTQIIAACNNCPCGWYGSSVKRCKCNMNKLLHYQQKLSGPLLDRIDIHLHFEQPIIQNVHDLSQIKTLAEGQTCRLKNWVQSGLDFSFKRNERLGVEFNSDISSEQLPAAFDMSEGVFACTIAQHFANYTSSRSLLRSLRVARTLADLDQVQSVREQDLKQAQFWSVTDS